METDDATKELRFAWADVVRMLFGCDFPSQVGMQNQALPALAEHATATSC
jgi:hypothetical protein